MYICSDHVHSLTSSSIIHTTLLVHTSRNRHCQALLACNTRGRALEGNMISHFGTDTFKTKFVIPAYWVRHVLSVLLRCVCVPPRKGNKAFFYNTTEKVVLQLTRATLFVDTRECMTDTYICECHMAGTWMSHGWHMNVTWLTHECHMVGTWMSHGWHINGSHMNVTWCHMHTTQFECRMQVSQYNSHTSVPLTTPSVKASYRVLLANLTNTITSPGTVKLMDFGEMTKVGGLMALMFTTMAMLGNCLYSWKRGTWEREHVGMYACMYAWSPLPVSRNMEVVMILYSMHAMCTYVPGEERAWMLLCLTWKECQAESAHTDMHGKIHRWH